MTPTSSAQSGGTYSYIIADIVGAWTSSGAGMAAYRYFVLYDSTSGNLIGWWDNGAPITLAVGDSQNIDADNVNGLFQIA